MIDATQSFVNRDDLCESLIDNQILTEEQKTAPAIVYFSDMAKKSKRQIVKIMEGY